MENTKVDLINRIVELIRAFNLISFYEVGKEEYLGLERIISDILKENYGAFSLYFSEIKHTRDIDELYRVMNEALDYLKNQDGGDFFSYMLLSCLPWINVYGHNGYITEKPTYCDTWEVIEPEIDPEQSTEPQRLVPKELTTPEAKKVLQRAITAGLLNEDDYQPKQGVTRAQQKEFADLASQVLNLSNKWVVFGALWNVKNLGQVKTTDAKPETLMAVRKLFQDLGFDIDGKPINKREKFT